MYKPVDVRPIPAEKLAHVRESYRALCQRFLESATGNPYYDYVQSSIANDATLDRHVRAFELYAPYLEPTMTVLDWGCRQAPDSCMMRALHPELTLHGCDVTGSDFAVFHEYAGLAFKQLDHPYRLPYEDGTFDVVLSSGVLEHVGFEHESILELWRVLKDRGLLIVTFLPNRTSLSENGARLLRNYNGHNRLYGLEHTKQMFLRAGFVVEKCGYHQVFPTLAKTIKGGGALDTLANVGARLNRVAEHVPVVNALAANLFFVLRRVRHM